MKTTRLEHLLRMWEDCWWLCHAQYVLYKRIHPDKPEIKSGPMFHWKEYRGYLLNSITNGVRTDTFDYARFGGDDCDSFPLYRSDMEAQFNVLIQVGFVDHLLNWTLNSRRVFTLSPDLQTLLNATSLDSTTLREIKFPFTAFCVDLPRPILGDNGEEFDLIIVSSSFKMSEEGFCLQLVNKSADSYKPLSVSDKNELARLIMANKAPKTDKARRLAKVLGDRMVAAGHESVLEGVAYYSKHRDVPIPQLTARVIDDFIAENDTEEQADDVLHRAAKDAALRIVCGMCLYMKSLPSPSPYVSDWKQVERLKHMPTGCVSTEERVCELSTRFTLSPEDASMLSEVNVDRHFRSLTVNGVGPHFRHGYWRRPWGKGNDPTAEKSVWIYPLIVRPDLLKPGELPKGAQTILLARPSAKAKPA